MLPPYPFAPYCGSPPVPAQILARWNLDPILIAGLLVTLAVYVALSEPRLWGDGRIAPWRRISFQAGWTIGAFALVSPLCPLSVSLFAGRIAQHMILAILAAPLLALGEASRLLPRRVHAPPPARRRSLFLAAAAFAAAMWVWHAPGPYLATFESDAVYWLMHLTLFGSAFWLWTELLDRPGEQLAANVGATVFTGLQMSLLGAVITFADRPIYAPHAWTAPAWGLTQLEDQQFGGAIMWAPGGAIFVAALVLGVAAAFKQAEARALAGAQG